MSPARKTRSSARAAAAAGTQINNNDKKVNRKPGKKRVKILMDDNSSDDEPKITKFQVTSVHDGKILSHLFSLCYFDRIFVSGKLGIMTKSLIENLERKG
jgi:hypothetical protein